MRLILEVLQYMAKDLKEPERDPWIYCVESVSKM